MEKNNLWEQAKLLDIQTGEDIVGGFSVGFDKAVDEQTKDALMRFAYWVEDHYALPVTLWVDCKYRHYLVNNNKPRVGYRFYWVDFDTYPVFEREEDIPVIELAVRTDKRSIEDVLRSFAEAITLYYTWLAGQMREGVTPDQNLAQSILQEYWSK